MIREKAQENSKNAGKGRQLETNNKPMSIQSKVCMQNIHVHHLGGEVWETC